MGGVGKKTKIHAWENAEKKNSCKEEGKEKNFCRRKVQISQCLYNSLYSKLILGALPQIKTSNSVLKCFPHTT